jgi:aminoglycoside 6'-N-acetyltransferase
MQLVSTMITLRPATPADAPLLRSWDEQPHVVASDPNDDWQWETELANLSDWREPLIAELDGRPIGFLDMIDPAREPSRYWGETPRGTRAIDIWIGPADCLGRGYGTQMMRLALARCFAAPSVATVLIDPLAANTRAIRFYQRLGFRPVGRRWFGADDCLVHRLDRAGYECARSGERQRADPA